MKYKYLIALPIFPDKKTWNHQTILVSATCESDAIALVRHIKGNNVNIGRIEKVNY